jgi:hypothetical protein
MKSIEYLTGRKRKAKILAIIDQLGEASTLAITLELAKKSYLKGFWGLVFTRFPRLTLDRLERAGVLVSREMESVAARIWYSEYRMYKRSGYKKVGQEE